MTSPNGLFSTVLSLASADRAALLELLPKPASSAPTRIYQTLAVPPRSEPVAPQPISVQARHHLSENAMSLDVSGEGDFIRERVAYLTDFHPESLRTVVQGTHRVVIGCPPEHYRNGICYKGTRASSILHPRSELASLLREAQTRHIAVVEQPTISAHQDAQPQWVSMKQAGDILFLRVNGRRVGVVVETAEDWFGRADGGEGEHFATEKAAKTYVEKELGFNQDPPSDIALHQHADMAQIGPQYWARFHALAQEFHDQVGDSCNCGSLAVQAMQGFHDAVSVHLGKEPKYPKEMRAFAQFMQEATSKTQNIEQAQASKHALIEFAKRVPSDTTSWEVTMNRDGSGGIQAVSGSRRTVSLVFRLGDKDGFVFDKREKGNTQVYTPAFARSTQEEASRPKMVQASQKKTTTIDLCTRMTGLSAETAVNALRSLMDGETDRARSALYELKTWAAKASESCGKPAWLLAEERRKARKTKLSTPSSLQEALGDMEQDDTRALIHCPRHGCQRADSTGACPLCEDEEENSEHSERVPRTRLHQDFLRFLLYGAAGAAGATIAANVLSRLMAEKPTYTLPAPTPVEKPHDLKSVYNPSKVEGDQAQVDLGTLLSEIDTILKNPHSMGLVDPKTQRVLREAS